MDVHEALQRRRMTRAFDGTELDEDRLVSLCEAALLAPTAGHSRGVEFAVLAGTEGVARWLEAATDERWRASSARLGGLAGAGGAVVVACRPDRYAQRYAEPDKASSGLGHMDAWPVPYWFGDAGAATMALLLLCESAGLAACFLGAFRNEDALLALLGADHGALLYGTVLLGGAAQDQVPSRSLSRPGPSRAHRVGRGRLPSS